MCQRSWKSYNIILRSPNGFFEASHLCRQRTKKAINNGANFHGDEHQPNSTHNCPLILVANFIYISFSFTRLVRLWPIKMTKQSPHGLHTYPIHIQNAAALSFLSSFVATETKETAAGKTQKKKNVLWVVEKMNEAETCRWWRWLAVRSDSKILYERRKKKEKGNVAWTCWVQSANHRPTSINFSGSWRDEQKADSSSLALTPCRLSNHSGEWALACSREYTRIQCTPLCMQYMSRVTMCKNQTMANTLLPLSCTQYFRAKHKRTWRHAECKHNEIARAPSTIW